MSFDIGQKVLCVDDKDQGRPRNRVVAGQVYTIADIRKDGKSLRGEKGMALVLHELPPFLGGIHPITGRPCLHLGFFARRFRPIDDPAIELFRAMCKTKPKVKEKT